ncbi:FIST C-terminal domain-containing protein [Enterovibrio sp. ZSDZ35]|uniref:FIST C-terminal domain-containing protein n=1 Tax=Enterovibrio qingdaonensis TaxID=2899818 RepID=A0ABT5QLM7_9GAMM|nr:nitric oxide-sensing protein NosP [Enterovibrio sp. ZSDZ35]MDD1781578.1 FIST C-terminal domain-containing protein [Enterovibrio sp. ZSDZ35]
MAAPKTSSEHHQAIFSAATYQLDATKAARELAMQLDSEEIGFVLFFCSSGYDLNALGKEMQQAFSHCEVMGCTSAGEITDAGYAKSSISALGFSRRDFQISGMHVPLDGFDLQSAQLCITSLIDACQNNQKAPISTGTFVLTLIDGLSPIEERFLVTLDTALGRIPHFGGSAGDDVNLANTHVYNKGSFHTDSAIVVMFNTHCPFEVFTTHHIESLDSKLVVTQADSTARRVYEFNAEPAAAVYAREIGIDLTELRPEIYALHPLAALIGDQYYVRSIQKVNEDLSLDFYCAVDDGIVVTAMRPGDIFADMESKLETIVSRVGEPELTLGCDCFLRRLEIEQNLARDKAKAIFSRFRLLGFNTYGEQLNGIHMNQTLTGVMIGHPPASGSWAAPYLNKKAG